MSHEGKMRRGAKWNEHRDKEGNLIPEIANEPSRLADVNYFLEHSKPEEAPKEEKKKRGK